MNDRERQSFHPWGSAPSPSSVLIMRFHAMGDVALTLPACAALRTSLPSSRIDYLTSTASASIPAATRIFDAVYSLPIPDHRPGRVASALKEALARRTGRYDVIIDLQRNWMSRIVRIGVAPRAWGEFDRFSPITAHDRVVNVFRRAGFAGLAPSFGLPLHDHDILAARVMLMEHGWDGKRMLVVLNPAGLWATRNWPLDSYIRFAELCLDHEDARFLFVGTSRIAERAALLSRRLGKSAINLAGMTTPGEAFGLLQHASLVLSEDSGLMHMAWALGVPTVALFGSSRHVWSAPPGAHVRAFHSGDLPCGSCMQPQCRYGDNHCLTRLTPESVYRAAAELVCRAAEGVSGR